MEYVAKKLSKSWNQQRFGLNKLINHPKKYQFI